MDDCMKELKAQVMQRMDPSAEMDEQSIYEIIDDVIHSFSRERIISADRKSVYRKMIFNDIKRLDILQELLEDDSITEIMINGYDNIFYEREGKITKWDRQFESADRLRDIVQRIAGASNKIINEAVPIADTRLADGSRVNIVMNPVAINGPIITIRKFYDTPLSIDKMIEIGSISDQAAEFLEKLVRAKYNIFISGGTGSGKTTFLNALSNYIPKDERVITIEDSAELKLMGISNLVRLEARNANVEGNNAVTIRDLIKSALRMRPDRVIVGEIRGAEAIDMIQAMNTGHDGSLSTGHANGPEDMIRRIETMVLMGMDMPLEAIRGQIASAIDIVVQLGRLRDKTRRVLSISEVTGLKNGEVSMHRMYEFVEEGTSESGRIIGTIRSVGDGLIRKEKMAAAGISV